MESAVGMCEAGQGVRVGVGGRTVRAVCLTMAVTGLLACGLTLAPVAGASSGRQMKPIITRVRFHHGHLLLRDLRARSHRARAAIVGGDRISITQAPWQVVVIAFLSENEAILCGGAILNQTEVLTAGHCVYNPETRQPIPADQIVVGAGTADLKVKEPEEQASLASGVRVHPYYAYNPNALQPSPDDVAVLTLHKSLVFDSAVSAISPTPAGSLLGEGTLVNLAGFGEEDPLTEELNGELYAIDMTLGFSRACGGEDDALFLCASSPKGSDCFGDSGSGLIVPGSPATLIGVTDTVEVIEGKPCLAGAVGGFANIAAPEIRDFIFEGNPAPPHAPRGGGTSVHGVPLVGGTLGCEPGAWSNSPTFTYSFVDSATGRVLAQGSSSTYLLTGADLGRSILCQVMAANEGGTGVGRTPALAAVRPTAHEEEAARRKQEEEAATNKRHEEEATTAAAKKHQEEEAATAAKKHQEEEAAKGGVLASREGTPEATLASTSLQVNAAGAVNLKISCPAGASNCAGTVTLRTLNAVSASVAGAAKAKPAILTLATGSFTVPGGEVKTVTLHLSAKARALLARSHTLRARATVVAHNPAGATHTGQMIATLHAPKAKHGRH